MPDKCLDCPVPSADMDGFIVSGPGGAPRSEGSGVSSPEGPFVREAPQMGHVVIMGTVGADGNPGSLPDAPQVGWAYVVEDAGEYGGARATEGDMVYCMSLNPAKWGVLRADSDDSGRDLVSVSASLDCAASGGAWDAAVNSAYVHVTPVYYDPPFPEGGLSLETSGRTFVYRGSDLEDAIRRIPTLAQAYLTVNAGGRTLYYTSSADELAYFFSGAHGVDVGTVRPFIDSDFGFRLESREELTSQDPGGPDIVCTFGLVDFRSARLEIESVSASGALSVQTVDMSCLVPPEATPSAAGLMSASDKTKLDGLSQYPRITYVSTVKTPSIGQTENREMDMELVGTGRSRLFLQAGRGIAVYGQQDGTQFGGADRVKVTFGVVPSEFCGDGIHVETLGSAERGIISVLDYQGASASGAGVHGLVPAASSSETDHLLAGDGTWMRPATDAEIDALFAE